MRIRRSTPSQDPSRRALLDIMFIIKQPDMSRTRHLFVTYAEKDGHRTLGDTARPRPDHRPDRDRRHRPHPGVFSPLIYGERRYDREMHSLAISTAGLVALTAV